ncbi:putative phiE125 gp8 family phage protein [Rhodoblastus acidophilus]|uniref:head-tail connector protein n=1 Tax=Rhodoblastus acidophilus TaxID=1074 RepID=UPI002224C629|nr:head-tail connector protein [Rhodoblastus acidophilus]MCW2315309.1 putative phiE125 gp8 family phage protein [Rhodoblastus acidophilus]
MPGLWQKISGADTPIVSISEAKAHVNAADFSDDDTLLTALTGVATDRFDLENGIIGRPLLTQSWRYLTPAPISSSDSVYLRGYPPATGFLIDRAPLQAVTKIEYLSGGAYVEWAASNWVARQISRDMAFVRAATAAPWPTVDQDEAAWRITATLGYGDTPDKVPAQIRHAAKLMIGHWYANRDAVSGFGAALQETPMGVEALIAPLRAKWV